MRTDLRDHLQPSADFPAPYWKASRPKPARRRPPLAARFETRRRRCQTMKRARLTLPLPRPAPVWDRPPRPASGRRGGGGRRRRWRRGCRRRTRSLRRLSRAARRSGACAGFGAAAGAGATVAAGAVVCPGPLTEPGRRPRRRGPARARRGRMFFGALTTPAWNPLRAAWAPDRCCGSSGR